MIVLAVNCGSSSVKSRLVDARPDASGYMKTRGLADAVVDGILGGKPTVTFRVGESVLRDELSVRDHEAAVRLLVERFSGGEGLPRIEGVGHRLVHGGARYRNAVVIDQSVLAALEDLGDLAPLHNGPGLAGIRAVRAALGTQVPAVAVFDTAFHALLPDRAAYYAIPGDLARRHGVRRFGFHGLSYQHALARFCEMTETPRERASVVALHLGNGCSAAAVKNGVSIDTSMGFTPLEGLVMGTRSGDLDPALIGYLARKQGVPVETMEEWLNTRSGLLGLSGLTHDMRRLLAEESSHSGARLAVDVFCYRARKYIGAYLAALDGALAVLFTGGIGANSPEIRARICGGMEWCGLRIDPQLNAMVVGCEGRISPAHADLAAYAIPTDEEQVIARETACVCGSGSR